MANERRFVTLEDPESRVTVQPALDSDNGSRGSKPRRPRGNAKKNHEAGSDPLDDTKIEAAPAIIEPGVYDVKVERLERWVFPRGRKDERQPKITFRCVVYGGQFNGDKLPMRMNFDLPIRRGSKLWETILVATFPEKPSRISRISLRRLFEGRVFQAEVRTLVSPYRDKTWKPICGEDEQPRERGRTSVIDHFISAQTGPPDGYLL